MVITLLAGLVHTMLDKADYMVITLLAALVHTRLDKAEYMVISRFCYLFNDVNDDEVRSGAGGGGGGGGKCQSICPTSRGFLRD